MPASSDPRPSRTMSPPAGSLRRALGRALPAAVWMAAAALPGIAAAQLPAVVSTPGPGTTVALPVALAARIGADTAEGLTLRIRYNAGGGVAVEDVRSGDADFGVFGLSAAVMAHLADPRIAAIAASDDVAPWAMMVRSGLRADVRGIADLRGRAVGTNSGTLTTKTASRLMAELLLGAHGVDAGDVRFVLVGQSWDTVSSALRGLTTDAAMIDEPFATRLEAAGIGFPLANTYFPSAVERGLPTRALRGAVIVRRDRILANPDLAERFVRMLRRSLAWLRAQPPAAVVEALGAEGEERAALQAVLARYPDQFSADARFSTAQLAETERLVRLSTTDPRAARFSIEDVVLDRWAGRKP